MYKRQVPGAIDTYLHDLLHAGRLGQLFRIEDWLRWALDRIGSNTDQATFFGLFGTPKGQQVLQRALLETPIISMDGSYLNMLRTLLSQDPQIAGSLLRMAWQRLTTRS